MLYEEVGKGKDVPVQAIMPYEVGKGKDVPV
jgi:hypothetical protein